MKKYSLFKTEPTNEDIEEKTFIEDAYQMVRQDYKDFFPQLCIIFGYLVTAVSFIVFITQFITHSLLCNVLWLLAPAIGLPLFQNYFKKNPPQRTTFADYIIVKMWCVLGGIIVFSGLFAPFAWIVFIADTPYVLLTCLLVGLGITLTGVILNLGPFVVSGVLGMAMSFLSLIIAESCYPLLFSGIIFLTFCIPAHIVRFLGDELA
ncbi:MAG: hypothetical protein RRX93_01520 [Bacteroidales bacterium]